MEDLPFALGLDPRENVADIIVQVVRLRQRLRDLEDDEGTDRRLLVVVLKGAFKEGLINSTRGTNKHFPIQHVAQTNI